MIKQAIRYTLNSLGYSLIKNDRTVPEGYTIIAVGNFFIKINNNNAIRYCYEYHKDYGAQLSRLTSLLFEHHDLLKAIDIGANIGDSVALIKSGANVPVICFEGDEMVLDQFHENTKQFQNVDMIAAFLSDQTGELLCEFSKVGHNLTMIPSESSSKSKAVRFTSIDTCFEKGIINNHCKLLKVDTEGFDLKILRGGARFLEIVNPAIIFEFNRENLANIEDDPFSIFLWLLQRGYHQILFYESDGRFMFSSKLENQGFLKQLYDYVDAKNAKIYYLDIIIFHKNHNKFAEDFIAKEELHRLQI